MIKTLNDGNVELNVENVVGVAATTKLLAQPIISSEKVINKTTLVLNFSENEEGGQKCVREEEGLNIKCVREDERTRG